MCIIVYNEASLYVASFVTLIMAVVALNTLACESTQPLQLKLCLPIFSLLSTFGTYSRDTLHDLLSLCTSDNI